VGGRVVGTAEDVVHRGEIEHVFTITRALGSRGPRHLSRHFSSPSFSRCSLAHKGGFRRVRQTPASCRPPRRATPAPARREWPTARLPKSAGRAPATRPPPCPCRRASRCRAPRGRLPHGRP